MSFAYVTGAAGGAPGNDGAPVLRGLDGVSATGVRFPSHVCFSARASETSWCEAPEMCTNFGRFPLPRGPDFEGLNVFGRSLRPMRAHARALRPEGPPVLPFVAKEEAHGAIKL